jgi:serine/threonine-protein kinase
MTVDPSLASGVLIANRFRLEKMLGQGGMGSVWSAWHITLNIEVAVKFIDAQLVSNQDAWSRFSQEAMAAAKIKSPHVVSILDFGTDDLQRPYIAMELLQGEALASLLDREPALPLPMVARILQQACKGLARAHSARIVHRDIKPDNLFLCEDDEEFLLKILDFGIAKMAVRGLTHRTGTGQVLGTPLYMSPEQAYGNKPVDHRSDLYSLAVVAYRCVTGHVPFNSDGVGELIVAITSREPLPPSRFRAGLPPTVDAWFRRALHKEPAQRFASAREMSDAFAVACGLAPSASSTAQFAALTAADLANLPGPASYPGPLSASNPGLEETRAGAPGESDNALPLVRRGNPPSSHRQAMTLQGTTASFPDGPPSASGAWRPSLVWAAVAVPAVVVGGALGWYFMRSEASRPAPIAASAASTAVRPPASAAASGASAATAAQAPTSTPSGSGAPVISINSLPADTRAKGGGPWPRATAPTKAGTAPSPTTPATTATAAPTVTAPAPTTPATTPPKTDYGL